MPNFASMPSVVYINVILPLKLDWEPVYGIEMETPDNESIVGKRVLVDFAGKEYVGTVSGVIAEGNGKALPSKEKIKSVKSVATGLEPVSKEEIQLWKMVADYYLCSVGEVYKAAYPIGKTGLEIRKAASDSLRREREERKTQERKDRTVAKIALVSARIEKKKLQIGKARTEATLQKYSEEKAALEKLLSSLEEELQKTGSMNTDEEGRNAPAPIPREGASIFLTQPQTEAYSRIKEIFSLKKPALLHGVTGSGKTEIYLKLAEETLRKGKNVLFMVPEIALGRQLEERVRNVFPGELEVFHSGETAVSRREAAARIRKEKYLVLGTRSSVLLPHRNLGLIIIDEENDTSYKQDSPSPRYNGRETAIMMAGIFSADIVLGSATPSLEAIYNCKAGRFSLVSLDKRFYEGDDALVEVIDTVAERRKKGMEGNFSRKLISRINECLSSGGQALILRERRSYAPSVQCSECGHIVKCRKCNVPMSIHTCRGGNFRLVCHYCGRSEEYTGICPECGGGLAMIGAGTQKIEEEAKALFPGARIARLDGDSARSRNFETETIRKFARGETDILVGTQILSKGFDFSGLKLVAVLQADSILGQHDFRADEKAVSLLEQFRGRCGRRGGRGLFVIQTSNPEHPVYKALMGEMTYSEVMGKLLEERRLFGYPPYSRSVEITLKDGNPGRLEAMGRSLSSALGARLRDGAMISGLFPPPVDMVAGKHIRRIRILLRKDRMLSAGKKAVAGVVSAFEKERKYSGHISLDVDPV